MIELKVDLGARSYPILIGDGLLGTPRSAHPPTSVDAKWRSSANTTVGPLFLDQLKASLGGIAVDVIELKDGERFKTLDTYAGVIDALMDKRHNRTTTLVALGGGVIGDLAGFAAATFQRGVAFVQVPTHAACAGGCLGRRQNRCEPIQAGKNMIGAFHQPRCVLADTATLATLPTREYRAGLAEVVKYGRHLECCILR